MVSQAIPRRRPWESAASPRESKSEMPRRARPDHHTVPRDFEMRGSARRRRDGDEVVIIERDSDEESSDRFIAVSSDEEADFDFDTEIPLYAPSIATSTTESAKDAAEDKPEVTSAPDKPRTTSLQPRPGVEVYNIQYSRYLDDEYEMNEVRAEIEHNPISTSTADRAVALFRWIHLQQDPMDFGAFQNTAKSLPDLTEEELGNAMRLLQSGQRQAQKPFRTKDGHRGRVFGPLLLSKEIANKALSVEDTYLFYSLPYFCLRKYTDLSVSSNSSLHPTRTLLQTKDPSTSKGRDMKQAVCQISGSTSNECFHVSTLWCLVIKDKYLVTCSLHSAAELSGRMLEILKRPPSPPSVTSPERPPSLQVLYENALYLIPLGECDSWFKFTQRFSVLRNEFDDAYTVHLDGRQIESGQWHVVMKRARRQPMRTRIVVSMRQHYVRRSLNKAWLGRDDLSDIAPLRPSTPSKNAMSSTPPTSGEKAKSTQEEIRESPDRRKSDRSGARLTTPLSGGLTAPDPLKRTPSASAVSLERYLEDFHALRWISVKMTGPMDADDPVETAENIPRIAKPEGNRSRKSYDEKVDSYLEELHKYMESKVDGVSQMKYQSCPKKSLNEVEKALAGIVRGGLDNAKAVSLKQHIVTAAKSIFLIFLPLDQKGTIVLKYWGAVHTAILAPLKRNMLQVRDTVEMLMSTARLCVDMQAQLSKGKGPNPAETNLPGEFVRAWFHLLICQLNMSQETITTARKRAVSCFRLLNTAIDIVMTKFEGKPLPQLRGPVPAELSVFFAHRVLQDMTEELPNISDTYWKYFTELESMVKRSPLDRSHQAKVAAFLEELEIIREQQKEQQKVVAKLRHGPLREREHEFRMAFSGRYHTELLRQCRDNISAARESLSELQRKAQNLEASWKNYIQSSKEQQERAIYVFTIVTIVFLPISTVSSIFGMNASDVRNMDQGQWVFWAVAIPVTAVVVVGSLFGAGVLPYRGRQSLALPRAAPLAVSANDNYPAPIPPSPVEERVVYRRRSYSPEYR